jgi:transposase
MSRGIPLRKDYNSEAIRALARQASDGKQARRLLALSMIYDGEPRQVAARHADVTLQTIRDWVLWFNAEGPEGLLDGKSTGSPPKLTARHKAALARVVEEGPKPYLDGVVRWRLCDLAAWLYENHGVSVDVSTVSRMLRDMGYRKLTARPRHFAQNPEMLTAFKKTSRPRWNKFKADLIPARP